MLSDLEERHSHILARNLSTSTSQIPLIMGWREDASSMSISMTRHAWRLILPFNSHVIDVFDGKGGRLRR